MPPTPFSLEKITWVEKTKRVIYRSSRIWRTKRNATHYNLDCVPFVSRRSTPG